MKKSDWIETIRKNIAISSVGRSTLQSQSGKGREERAREYLINSVQLDGLCKYKEMEFSKLLNKHTISLSKKLLRPDNNQPNWGAARKVLNIYFRLCAMNKDLSEYFRLGKIENYLELPLDNPNVKKIDEKERTSFSKDFKIRTLQKKFSDRIQLSASKIAKAEKIHRYELDVLFWNQ